VAAIRLVDTAIETIPEAASELLRYDLVDTLSRLILVLGCSDSTWVLAVDSFTSDTDAVAEGESRECDSGSVDLALLEAKRMCLVTLLHLLRQGAASIENTPVFPAHLALLYVWQKLPYLAVSFFSFHSPIVLAMTELVYEVTMQIEPYFASALVLCTSLASHVETIRPDGSAALGLEQVVGKIYDLLEVLGHLLIWRFTYQKDVDHLSTLCSSLLQKLALLQAAATTMRVPSNLDPAEPEKNGTPFQTEVKWAHIRHQVVRFVHIDRCASLPMRCMHLIEWQVRSFSMVLPSALVFQLFRRPCEKWAMLFLGEEDTIDAVWSKHTLKHLQLSLSERISPYIQSMTVHTPQTVNALPPISDWYKQQPMQQLAYAQLDELVWIDGLYIQREKSDTLCDRIVSFGAAGKFLDATLKHLQLVRGRVDAETQLVHVQATLYSYFSKADPQPVEFSVFSGFSIVLDILNRAISPRTSPESPIYASEPGSKQLACEVLSLFRQILVTSSANREIFVDRRGVATLSACLHDAVLTITGKDATELTWLIVEQSVECLWLLCNSTVCSSVCRSSCVSQLVLLLTCLPSLEILKCRPARANLRVYDVLQRCFCFQHPIDVAAVGVPVVPVVTFLLHQLLSVREQQATASPAVSDRKAIALASAYCLVSLVRSISTLDGSSELWPAIDPTVDAPYFLGCLGPTERNPESMVRAALDLAVRLPTRCWNAAMGDQLLQHLTARVSTRLSPGLGTLDSPSMWEAPWEYAGCEGHAIVGGISLQVLAETPGFSLPSPLRFFQELLVQIHVTASKLSDSQERRSQGGEQHEATLCVLCLDSLHDALISHSSLKDDLPTLEHFVDWLKLCSARNDAVQVSALRVLSVLVTSAACIAAVDKERWASGLLLGGLRGTDIALVKALRIVTDLVVDSASVASQLASDPEAMEALLSTRLNTSRSFPARAEALSAVHELLQGGHVSAVQVLDRIRAQEIPDFSTDLFVCPVDAIELLDRRRALTIDSELARPACAPNQLEVTDNDLDKELARYLAEGPAGLKPLLKRTIQEHPGWGVDTKRVREALARLAPAPR
jgi:hypothetical protein